MTLQKIRFLRLNSMCVDHEFKRKERGAGERAVDYTGVID